MKLQREKKHVEAGDSRRGTVVMSISGSLTEVRAIEKILDANWDNTMCEGIEEDQVTIFYSVPSNFVADFRNEYKLNK